MKTILIEDIYFFLKQCDGVLIEDNFVVPTLDELQDDYSAVFLTLEWNVVQDGEEVLVGACFSEGDNQTAMLDGCVLTLINTDGEEEELTLLKKWTPS